MDSASIAVRLRELAAYHELEGDRFRARAYRRAAGEVEGVAGLGALSPAELEELPGVGRGIAGVIGELARTGTVSTLERLRARWPAVVLELAELPGVGPAKARKLHEALAPRSLDEVAAFAERGFVRTLKGFGPVSERRLLEGIRAHRGRGGALVLAEARELCASLALALRGAPGIGRVEVCGPVRRWIEVVERIALAVETEDVEGARERLRRHPLVVSSGALRPDVMEARLASGLLCELHTAPRGRFGVAQVLATGSEQHVALLRAHARERGFALEALRGADERDVYAALALPWLPPEVRDGTDELAAALAGDPFDLVELADVTGAVHCHTVASDGRATIAEMAAAAAARGHAFLTVTDHSESAAYAGGLSAGRLLEQRREIEAVQPSAGLRILAGTEADILADGALDYRPDVLETLDVVIASVHQRHKLDPDAMTRRLTRAMRQPLFKIWGHPLGRLLLRREPLACRLDEVLDAIAESPAAIEINGDPSRLDLPPEHARAAARRGIRFVLSSDAHSPAQLGHVEYAVALARRARLGKRDVLNTLAPEEFLEAVRPARPVRMAGSGARARRA